jgi:hypothetical protein
MRLAVGGGLILSAGVVVGILALLGLFSEAKPKAAPQASFAFDSPYEVKRAESLVSEEVLRKEMNSEEEDAGDEEEHPDLEADVGIKSERCTVSPPPPEAIRLVCRVVVSVKELHEHAKGSHINAWDAVVLLNAHNGGLALKLSKLSSKA